MGLSIKTTGYARVYKILCRNTENTGRKSKTIKIGLLSPSTQDCCEEAWFDNLHVTDYRRWDAFEI